MTIQECYLALHGDYNDAKARLMMDKLVEKFMLKFPADPTMDELRHAVSENDRATAFRAVHTLKGVAANLAFTELYTSASNLTEQLRDGQHDPDPALMAEVEKNYQLVIATLEEYVSSKQ